MIINLTDISLYNKNISGMKAYNLSIIRSLGWEVPPGFLLSTEEMRNFMKQANIDITSKYSIIREEILNTPLPMRLVDDIKNACRTIDPYNVMQFACRSSATDEDLTEASFAGQYETVLAISGFADLLMAIKKCWSSVYKDTIKQYRTHLRLPERQTNMGVLVQEMVKAQYAGVIFSTHPTGKPKTMVFEIVQGLGDTVVDGTGKTIHIEVNKETGSYEYIHHLAAPFIHHEQIQELWETAKRLEDWYQYPVDIEFAYGTTISSNENKIYILQCRPLTCQHSDTIIQSSDFFEIVIGAGLGVSSGSYCGRVNKVTQKPDCNFYDGDILVASELTMDMYPLLFKAGAIIIENNNMVSHACTVSRELSLPCIVGFPDIQLLCDGDEIIINGTTGLVSKYRTGLYVKKSQGDEEKKQNIYHCTNLMTLDYCQRNDLNIGLFDPYQIVILHLAKDKSNNELLHEAYQSIEKRINQFSIKTVLLWVPLSDELVRIYDRLDENDFNEIIMTQFKVFHECLSIESIVISDEDIYEGAIHKIKELARNFKVDKLKIKNIKENKDLLWHI